MSNDAIAAVGATGIPTPPAAAKGIHDSAGARDPKQVMDSEVFMSLLVAQLRHQDPSSPMDSNQMISQTAELASMEKLTSMATTATENFALQMRTSAAALIGQQISWTDDGGTQQSGIATSVSFDGGVPQVSVGGHTVALDLISGVTSALADESGGITPPPGTGEDITAV